VSTHIRLTIPQIRRLTDLARAGLSDSAVAVVLNLDYGLALTPGRVRGWRQRYAPDVRNSKHAPRLSVDHRENFVRELVS
jgi:hypothetical protein